MAFLESLSLLRTYHTFQMSLFYLTFLWHPLSDLYHVGYEFSEKLFSSWRPFALDTHQLASTSQFFPFSGEQFIRLTFVCQEE